MPNDRNHQGTRMPVRSEWAFVRRSDRLGSSMGSQGPEVAPSGNEVPLGGRCEGRNGGPAYAHSRTGAALS